MQKLTPLVKLTDEAIIIAEGPSKEKILRSPEFAEGRTVAVVNRAGLNWPGHVDYWITYHAEWIARWVVDRDINGHPPADLVIVSANKMNNLSHLTHYNITAQANGLNSGGTSSILAAMVLIDIGYSPIHLFGVDMTQKYSKDRKFWRILKGENLLFHGDDWWHKGLYREEK